MDGGLALFGFGLFLLSIAGMYARSALGLTLFVLALSLASMGLAFSEWKRLREVSLGLGVLLLGAGLISLFTTIAWWMVLALFLFSAAYFVLWAEFRFPFFGNVRQDEVPHHPHGRWRIHWPRREHRA